MNKTWAALLRLNESLWRSWAAAGVELIDSDFISFIPVLRHYVETFLRPSLRRAAD